MLRHLFSERAFPETKISTLKFTGFQVTGVYNNKSSGIERSAERIQGEKEPAESRKIIEDEIYTPPTSK